MTDERVILSTRVGDAEDTTSIRPTVVVNAVDVERDFVPGTLTGHPRCGFSPVPLGLTEAVPGEETTTFMEGRVEEVLVPVRAVESDPILLVKSKEFPLDLNLTLEEFDEVGGVREGDLLRLVRKNWKVS